MASSTALLIARDDDLRSTLQRVVEKIPNLCLTAVSQIGEAEEVWERDAVVLVLIHLNPDTSAEAVLSFIRQVALMKRPVPTIVIAGACTENQASRWIHQGAAGYLSCPLDPDRTSYFMDALTIWARYPALPACPAAGLAAGAEEDERFLLYLPSGAMGRLMKQVRLVAPQDTTLLLMGETGTGKTRLARLIHDLSGRREEPFLLVNCGVLAGNLIESEMFGHVKGAFTGAERDRAGKFAQVGRGTLLLDEIDALPVQLQVKLLRAVEERVFEPVGSNRSSPVLARIIAASNRSLDQEVRAGRFREDLYYRLNVVGFSLPALRERASEIPRMVHTFIREFAGRNGRLIAGIAEDALKALEAYRWPGNIRELRNVIERAAALCPGTVIQMEDLPEAIRSGPSPGADGPEHLVPGNGSWSPLDRAKWKAEVLQITEALERHCDNRLRAAAELGISRRTFYKKLHRYGLMQPKLLRRDAARQQPSSAVNGL